MSSGKNNNLERKHAWTYSQSTGQISRNGTQVGVGYSGRGAGKNNHAMQNVRSIGPIPVGTYAIGAPFHHPHAGNYTMRLTPQVGTDTLGRTGMLIHGDSIQNPGQASSGCIVQNQQIRRRIWTSGDRTLQVIP
ncbi:DUF2778 domain-containing protein [Burkholderia gladioli]|nr:DUF2778 domain-containing protein [Burkholderia gladioli pv. gladioli]MBU9173217.1 DUF2778 domain-containing protein [Burkholderia gladioli]AWY52781.1 DUF2778 domain-containing protein [Burkholderia gladioli pv. gladioli]MBU9272515.1 DUF2778 domain-containing protein [Burkholderia gladioli]PRE25884.1 DUF2778 domain-containing protein [Burkholderia gladioli]